MKSDKEKHVGTALILMGLMLVMAGMFLAIWHFWNNYCIEQNTQEVLLQMNDIIWGNETGAERTSDREMAQKLKNLYKTHPEVSMPVASIGEDSYVGRMDITGLNLSLPVLSACEDGETENVPCRYEGSAYQDNLVIGFPVCRNHFENLEALGLGDQVSFTDMDGNCFTYDVTAVEQIEEDQIGQLQSGDWDLILYEPTSRGQSLVVVSCKKTQEDEEALRAFLPSE